MASQNPPQPPQADSGHEQTGQETPVQQQLAHSSAQTPPPQPSAMEHI
ncbi:hypothetical protein PI124_g20875 [Phytophthora idaei]|nr:hypothetical protein PI125_g16366 [Phytophthora idaei]KAG3134563.1 hypothetical protein PI126_g18640 [Phytophthora idaei]KAG3234064.1 hypothetical protein PI124_g20875 [Phytophthora idaei]